MVVVLEEPAHGGRPPVDVARSDEVAGVTEASSTGRPTASKREGNVQATAPR
jgi:hypothetical protein